MKDKNLKQDIENLYDDIIVNWLSPKILKNYNKKRARKKFVKEVMKAIKNLRLNNITPLDIGSDCYIRYTSDIPFSIFRPYSQRENIYFRVDKVDSFIVKYLSLVA